MISRYICIEQEQSNLYLHLQLYTFELFQIESLVSFKTIPKN